MKKEIKKYWNIYYKKKKDSQKPSNFCYFISKKFINKNNILIDIGTGDGRDAFYFTRKVKFIYGIDLSNIVIKHNKRKAKLLSLKNIKFKNISISNLKKLKNKKINFIYGRFFLHAIDDIKENIFLNSLKKYFNKNNEILVALEFRTNRDKLINLGKKISKYERITDHYRRFIHVKNFEKKLKNKKFKIIYKKQGINLSKTKKENPYLCRLVFKI
tara:strand:- start:113 stop:757 length:645 start_codon:yes stop_codon:yes gene_type:complete